MKKKTNKNNEKNKRNNTKNEEDNLYGNNHQITQKKKMIIQIVIG